MDLSLIDPDLLTVLLRFLYLGTEKPIYFPGNWSSNNRFEKSKLFDEYFRRNNDNAEVVNIIVQVYKEGLYTRYETIVFVLCKCILLGGPKVKEASYKAVLVICQTSEELMLFAKYTRILKSGNGQGWCKSIRTWYNTKDPSNLAREFARVKGRHGINHSMLLKKSHIKVLPGDVTKSLVIKYGIFGFKHLKESYGGQEEAAEILNYFELVDNLKHCEEPSVASEMAIYYKFTLDHMPEHLLTFQDVWNAILPQMSLSDILCNLIKIHNFGFLSPNSTTQNVITFLLNDKHLIKKSNLTPLAVYITLCNYYKKVVPMKFAKMRSAFVKTQRRRGKQEFDPETGLWKWIVPKRHPKELKHMGIDDPPNRAIIVALNKLINETCLLVPPIGVQYLITVDMREHMFKGKHFCKPQSGFADQHTDDSLPSTSDGGTDNPEKMSKKHISAECFYNRGVVPGDAAIVLTSYILKREKNVRIAVFTDDGIQIVKLNRNFEGILENKQILIGANNGRVQLDAPIQWAMKTKAKIDVFINMVDRTTRYTELDKEDRAGRGPGGRYTPVPPQSGLPDHCPARALEKYRLQCDQPNSKLIVMSLASHRICTTDGSHSGILDIVGIDNYVPNIIDAFIQGKFY